MARYIARAIFALVIGIAPLGGFAFAQRADAHSSKRWNWLKNTYWYVETAYLPALSTDVSTQEHQPVSDQTVWRIDGAKDGYIWGKTFVQITGRPKQCLNLVGSVTPDGNVQIVFLISPSQNVDLAIKTTGMGRMRRVHGQWKFEMQMTTGTTSLITHWAFMTQCKEGQSCENRLPGTDNTLEQFVQPCPSQ